MWFLGLNRVIGPSLVLGIFVVCLSSLSGGALAQDRFCLDGKRSVSGVCPDDVDNSLPQRPDSPALHIATSPKGFKDCDTCPEMVRIPAGSFLMGSVAGEGDPNERPQRRVLVRGFSIGRYEVTQAEWEAVMGKAPDMAVTAPNHARDFVSWAGAQEFVRKLSLKTSRTYRLPSEAEWEYAARAGSDGSYSFGNDESQLGEHAWFSDNSGNATQTVGKKRPNRFGLHDVHGNLWEWTLDCWNENHVGAPANATARLSGDCESRPLRGGSYNTDPDQLRAASRIDGDTTDWPLSIINVGLRVVRND